MRRLFLVTPATETPAIAPEDQLQDGPVVESPTPEIDPGDTLLSDLFGIPIQPEETTEAEIAPLAAETTPGTTPGAPAASPPVASPTTPPSPELDTIRLQLQASEQKNLQYEQQLQRQLEEQREEQQRQSLDQETQQIAQQLQTHGITPEAAAQFANQQRQRRESQNRETRELKEQVTEMQSKMTVALKVAEEYGVSAEHLMQFSTPTAMQESGQLQKLIRDQKANDSAQKKASVPSQTFDSATPAAPGDLDGAKLEHAVGEGTIDLTPDVVKRLTAYHKKQGFI